MPVAGRTLESVETIDAKAATVIAILGAGLAVMVMSSLVGFATAKLHLAVLASTAFPFLAGIRSVYFSLVCRKASALALLPNVEWMLANATDFKEYGKIATCALINVATAINKATCRKKAVEMDKSFDWMYYSIFSLVIPLVVGVATQWLCKS